MLAGRAFERQELVFAADVLKEDPAYAPYYAAAGSQAVMAAPISARQRRLGVLVAYAHRAPMFAQSDLEILQLLANQMAVILDNRLLIEEAVDARAQDEANRLRERAARGHFARFAESSGGYSRHRPGTGATSGAGRGRLIVNDSCPLLGLSTCQRIRCPSSSTSCWTTPGSRRPNRSTWIGKRPIWWRSLAELSSRSRRRAKPTRVHVETATESLTGEWDTSRLERALQNLLTNALKYSPHGGEIVVRVDQQDVDGCQWAVLEVEDHGLGIPADEVAGIFERFRRARNVTGRIPGTGIGLATARQIVEQHGGTIEVQSAEGKGTTFTLRLPGSRRALAER